MAKHNNNRPTGKSGQKYRRRGCLYNDMMETAAFIATTHNERSLMQELTRQYTGYNNGNLNVDYGTLKHRGYTRTALRTAYEGLLEKGFIVKTRQGQRRRGFVNLIAVTWQGIDDPKDYGKGGKIFYDAGVKADSTPLNLWAKDPRFWPDPYKKIEVEGKSNKKTPARLTASN